MNRSRSQMYDPRFISEAAWDLRESHGSEARNYAARRLEAAHRMNLGNAAGYWLAVYRCLQLGEEMPAPYTAPADDGAAPETDGVPGVLTEHS
ncbi:hypothetical protein LOC54_11330 [Acetobacter sp. AN02]|uniref:hypothetical protein n=1 Tax=Acetobacter sp. AN02 TaxID=2894186 RepID=UPI0024341081|nr:hypothetical protein [Acetobacter sp. AN02]MDG6095667.1 hypothetical protein [Acetobacter sp. AN02]